MTDISAQIQALRTECGLSDAAAELLVAAVRWDGHAYRDTNARGAACGAFMVGGDAFDAANGRELVKAKFLRVQPPAPPIRDILRDGAGKRWFRVTLAGFEASAAAEQRREDDREQKLRHQLRVAEDVYARDHSTDRFLSLESARTELSHYLATKAVA